MFYFSKKKKDVDSHPELKMSKKLVSPMPSNAEVEASQSVAAQRICSTLEVEHSVCDSMQS